MKLGFECQFETFSVPLSIHPNKVSFAFIRAPGNVDEVAAGRDVVVRDTAVPAHQHVLQSGECLAGRLQPIRVETNCENFCITRVAYTRTPKTKPNRTPTNTPSECFPLRVKDVDRSGLH